MLHWYPCLGEQGNHPIRKEIHIDNNQKETPVNYNSLPNKTFLDFSFHMVCGLRLVAVLLVKSWTKQQRTKQVQTKSNTLCWTPPKKALGSVWSRPFCSGLRVEIKGTETHGLAMIRKGTPLTTSSLYKLISSTACTYVCNYTIRGKCLQPDDL